MLSMLLYDSVDKFVIYDNEKSSSLRLDQVWKLTLLSQVLGLTF